MGLMDRDYVREAPRWHVGEYGEMVRTLPRTPQVWGTPAKRQRQGGLISRTIKSALVAGLISGAVWAMNGGIKISYVSTPAVAAPLVFGVHVCYKENFDLHSLSCRQEDRELGAGTLSRALLVFYAPAGQTLGPRQDFWATVGGTTFTGHMTIAKGQLMQAINLSKLMPQKGLSGPVQLKVTDGTLVLGTTSVVLEQ